MVSESSNGRDRGFWHTVPGILTALAGLLTAVTGLYIAVVQNRSDQTSAPPRQAENAAVTRPVPPGGAPVAGGGVAPGTRAGEESTGGPVGGAVTRKPWAESDAVLTAADGSQTTVRADSLCYCISVTHALTLGSGQTIPFERMRAIEFVRSDPMGAANAQASLLITLLDGRTLTGTIGANCDFFGYNDLGRFSLYPERLRRIDFNR